MNDRVIKVAVAAPKPPNLGINKIFNPIFNPQATKVFNRFILGNPVMFSVVPPIPKTACMKAAVTIIIKIGYPWRNWLPNINIIFLGKSKIRIANGREKVVIHRVTNLKR